MAMFGILWQYSVLYGNISVFYGICQHLVFYGNISVFYDNIRCFMAIFGILWQYIRYFMAIFGILWHQYWFTLAFHWQGRFHLRVTAPLFLNPSTQMHLNSQNLNFDIIILVLDCNSLCTGEAGYYRVFNVFDRRGKGIPGSNLSRFQN